MTIPEHQCACWRLTEPFADGDLPDHVCLETMIGTINSAMRDGVIPHSEWWPVRLRHGRKLGLVLRQWVQEPPNPTLAALLKDSQRWNHHMYVWQLQLEKGLDAYEAADLTRRVEANRYLANRLREDRLPDTPATIEHLRAVAAGRDEPLPARGLLVTTQAYVTLFHPPDGSRTAGAFHPPHDVAVTGVLNLATAELWERARHVANTHRSCLQRWRCPSFARIRGAHYYALSDPHAKSLANPFVMAERKELDYLAEALTHQDELLAILARTHPVDHAHHVATFLKQVHDRVRRRRQRQRMAGTRPGDAGWRRRFRQHLDGVSGGDRWH